MSKYKDKGRTLLREAACQLQEFLGSRVPIAAQRKMVNIYPCIMPLKISLKKISIFLLLLSKQTGLLLSKQAT